MSFSFNKNTCKLRKDNTSNFQKLTIRPIMNTLIHTYTLLMESFEYNCLTLGDPLLDLFLLDRVLLGLRGLDSFVELGEHGGELGRNRGDCLLEDLGDVRYWRVMLSPWQSWRRFSFRCNCVSGSLNHRANSSSTLLFSSGFNAILIHAHTLFPKKFEIIHYNVFQVFLIEIYIN